jgi:hypothetical protein
LTADVLGHSQRFVHEDGTETDIAGLQERRQRVVMAFVDGNLPEEDYRSRLAEIDAELGRLTNLHRATVTFALGLDWSSPERDLNARLREVLHSVVLGPDMRPFVVRPETLLRWNRELVRKKWTRRTSSSSCSGTS